MDRHVEKGFSTKTTLKWSLSVDKSVLIVFVTSSTTATSAPASLPFLSQVPLLQPLSFALHLQINICGEVQSQECQNEFLRTDVVSVRLIDRASTFTLTCEIAHSSQISSASDMNSDQSSHSVCALRLGYWGSASASITKPTHYI